MAAVFEEISKWWQEKWLSTNEQGIEKHTIVAGINDSIIPADADS